MFKNKGKLSVLGRMFIVHEKEDDLGMGEMKMLITEMLVQD